MKSVLQHILQHKRRYQTLPFFDFLRDESRSPTERLAFFPCMAPFILGFGDLNRCVLREEPTNDPHQQMVNEHTYEDDHHWPWYLEDLTKLGHDRTALVGDMLREIYSERSEVNRLLMPRLAHLVWNADPLVRLAIIEAIEETGNVLFALTAKIAKVYEQETGTELRYCGEFHFQLESGHAMTTDHAVLAKVELDPVTRQHALECADQVFAWFRDWTDELLRYAQQELATRELLSID
jgi:hypothetical protein